MGIFFGFISFLFRRSALLCGSLLRGLCYLNSRLIRNELNVLFAFSRSCLRLRHLEVRTELRSLFIGNCIELGLDVYLEACELCCELCILALVSDSE